jgi:hypothetical protein
LSLGCASADPVVAPPRLLGAEKMLGSLHVSWTNPAQGCDTVELERQTTATDGKITAAFALLYTLPGAADNKHDATATEDVSYAYRLRCLKSGRYSEYSNEIAANPTR